MGPRKSGDDSSGSSSTRKSRRRPVDRNSMEYQTRRDRNNVAVKKSRTRTKEKTKDTLARVSRLRNENKQLEQQVKILAKELGLLKDLFKMTHVGDSGSCAATATEASIQTDVAFGAQGTLDIKVETGDDADVSGHDDIRVNQDALQRDHQYVSKS